MAYRFLRFPGGKTKAVTFSYDDGSRTDLRLAEVLDRYNMKCTFNLNSSRLLEGSALTLDEAKALVGNGHEVAVHGKHHIACGIAPAADGIRDVLTCREELESAFGRIIRGMAYADTGITAFANGTDYATVRKYLTDLGIVYSRTLGADNDRFELPSDWLAWMPTAHHNNPQMFDFIEKFISCDVNSQYCAARYPRLFYIWGHSYEFEHNDNWNLLESICKKLGGKEDIWYATNIEIYEYVNAYNSLVWSADFKTVYNPTLCNVYFDIMGKAYCVRSGETLVTE